MQFSFFINGSHNIVLDYLAFYGTYIGDGVFAILLSILILFYDKKMGISLLAAYLISSGLAQALKHLIFSNFNRPYFFVDHKETIHHVLGLIPHLYNSFPSGHTTTAFMLFGMLSFRYGKIWLFLPIGLLVAYSRIYLFQHFLIDVVVGSALGLTSATLVYFYFIEQNFSAKILSLFEHKK
ncbi:MAG: phosphatase PAP2 family protein [Bacteroidia bacterium]